MKQPSSVFPGHRLADEGIYLSEDRFDEPKEYFKQIRHLIAAAGPEVGGALLDIGCATGELLHYLHGELPALSLAGVDISASLIERARAQVPGATFTVAPLEDVAAAPAEAFDYCVMAGVLGCLDDPTPALSNILTWLKPGGTALITDLFNDDPVDVVMRYRRADNPGAPWESGWNLFAKVSIDAFLGSSGKCAAWEYIPFRLPFALARRADPMRTWTIATETDPYQLVNGARQLAQLTVLKLRKQR